MAVVGITSSKGKGMRGLTALLGVVGVCDASTGVLEDAGADMAEG